MAVDVDRAVGAAEAIRLLRIDVEVGRRSDGERAICGKQ